MTDRPPLGDILAAYQERLERAREVAAQAAAAASEPSSDTRTFAERMAAWEAADNGPITCFDCAACTRDEDRPQVCNDPYGYCHPGPCEPRTDEWGQPVA